MTTKAIKYTPTMGDLLTLSETEDPTKTKIEVAQLPNTPQLQERYAITFCGPEAAVICGNVLTIIDALAAGRAKIAA